MTIKEMREKRVNLASQAQALLDRAEEEGRDLTAEEVQQFDDIHEEIDSLKRKIDRQERQEDLEAELRESQGTKAGAAALEGKSENRGQAQEEQSIAAFRSWLTGGMGALTPEQRAMMMERAAALTPEQRAMAAGVDTAGGYTCIPEFATRIESAMKAYSGIRNTRATIMRTGNGNAIPMSTSNDTENKGELLGENKPTSEKDIEMGSKMLRAYMFSSKMVRVSYQFLQDTSITNVESWLSSKLGERIGRATAGYYITGTGNNQPEGLQSATSLGKQGSTQTSIKYDELVDMEFSIDPAYRRQAEWLIADKLLKRIKQLKDGEGRPLWVPGVAVREPDTILGYRYAIDMEIPDPAASKITAYFGDFSKFILRDVTSMQMLRLQERYAEFLQIAFLLFARHDSMLLDAGTHPIKHFQQAAG